MCVCVLGGRGGVFEITGPDLEQQKDVTAPGHPPRSDSPWSGEAPLERGAKTNTHPKTPHVTLQTGGSDSESLDHPSSFLEASLARRDPLSGPSRNPPGPSFLRPPEEHMSPIKVLLSQHAIEAKGWAPWLGPPLLAAVLNMTHSALDLFALCVCSQIRPSPVSRHA